ncbi:MAG: sigma-E processing peptidase SpoIIGA, partial [Clostridia bacterium]|nr:sigma-E processing peptidase SpoIIGA [Clostridia bacterium]
MCFGFCYLPKKGGRMTEYIYGDVLFIINFSMDFIALFICGKIMHFRMNPWRMALAATLGGVYGVAA